MSSSDRSDSSRPRRRVVDLAGFGLLPDGTTFGVTVVDLSYDGCKVRTALPLIPGIIFKISMVGLGGALDAKVQWFRDGYAGLKFAPDGELESPKTPRQAERIIVSAKLSLRRQGRHQYEVRSFDLTAFGSKIEFVERPHAGELVWVKFDGLEAIEAKVRWVDGFFGGLEFVRPIYPAVFQMLLTRLGVQTSS